MTSGKAVLEDSEKIVTFAYQVAVRFKSDPQGSKLVSSLSKVVACAGVVGMGVSAAIEISQLMGWIPQDPVPDPM